MRDLQLPEPIRALAAQLEGVVYVAKDDAARTPIAIGPSAEPILGFTPEELCADPELFLGHIHPQDRERVRAEIAAGRGAPFLPLKYRFIHKTGRVLYCRESQVAQPGTGVVAGVTLDATEMELPQRALQAAIQAPHARGAVQAVCEAAAQSLGLAFTIYLDARSDARAIFEHGELGVLRRTRWDDRGVSEPWGSQVMAARGLDWSGEHALDRLSSELRQHVPGSRFGFALPVLPESPGAPAGVLIGLALRQFGLPATYQRALEQLALQTGVALQRAELIDALRRTGRERQQLSDALVRAHEAERGRIARELHDGAGQTLTAVAIQLDLAEQASGPAARKPLAKARQQLERTLEELRGLSHALRPAALDDLGLLDALDEMAHALCSSELQVQVDAPANLPTLPSEVATCLFRIAQSALTNVVRHARATRATVRLTLAEHAGRQSLKLEIDDDGRGIVEPDPSGIGLLAIRERALALGGAFSFQSLPGRGARVVVSIPL